LAAPRNSGVRPMEEAVVRVIAEICYVNPEELQREALLADYGLDSARAMDLLVALEEAFHVRISDEVASKLRRVADVVDYVCARATP
jgi:acyl carrier protein